MTITQQSFTRIMRFFDKRLDALRQQVAAMEKAKSAVAYLNPNGNGNGLAPRKRLTHEERSATDVFSAEDTISRWLEERCVPGRQYETSSSALFANFKSWAEEVNEWKLTHKAFSQKLRDRGFTLRHTREGGFFKGVALRTDMVRERKLAHAVAAADAKYARSSERRSRGQKLRWEQARLAQRKH